jgi:site-specific recombinase XerD
MNTTNSLARLRPPSQHQYRQLPIFGGIIDAFAQWNLECGFSLKTVRFDLNSIRRLVPWFQRRRKQIADDLTAEDVAEARSYYRLRNPHWAAAIGKLGNFLKTIGRLKLSPGKPPAPSELEIARYLGHLRRDRGLAEKTIEGHQHYLQHFLRFLDFDQGQDVLKHLTLEKIQRFLRHISRRYSREVMSHLVASVRAFLRFQFTQNTLRQPLHSQIDTVRMYRGERLPHPLPWEDLQNLLQSMDCSTVLEQRDFTILLLAASYGLRRSEVAALTLDDIDWHAGTLRIPQAKTRQTLWLPLTDEAGSALADYLKRRPVSSHRQVFLRQRPPDGPLQGKGVSATLARAIRNTGVEIQTKRFHSLRHAVALRLLRQGTPLKSISDLLGHRNPKTTSEYLRLDIEDLRQVALPVPGHQPSVSSEKTGSKPQQSGTTDHSHRGVRRKVTNPPDQGWQSFLARPIQDYLVLQRSLGRGYQREEWILRGLDCFLARHSADGRIFTATRFDAWAAGLQHLSPTGVRSRLLCVRKFCLHMARTHAPAFVPDLRKFPKMLPPRVPYLLSAGEMAQVLEGIRTIHPNRKNPLRPQTMRLGLLLMFCCGLRRGELLRLQLADIDTNQQCLRLNQTKFHKSRLVPFSPTVAEELRTYLQQRSQKGLPMEPTSPLLWNGRAGRFGGALSPTAILANWVRICRCAQVLDHRGRPPRIHDLRHSFAVAALQQGYEIGCDAQATLPRLSLYLGHVSPVFTHYYLKFTEPISRAAGDRFHQQFGKSLVVPILSKGGVA